MSPGGKSINKAAPLYLKDTSTVAGPIGRIHLQMYAID